MMNKMALLMYKQYRSIRRKIIQQSSQIKNAYINSVLKKIESLELGEDVTFEGMPWISLRNDSRIIIGSKCTFLSNFYANVGGINHSCILATIKPTSIIRIGSECGFSGVTLIAAKSIEIGNNVAMGVNSCVYDTDFHSIDPIQRRTNIQENVIAKPVIIGNDVWIAANAIILKGVIIGDRSIVGAGSVVIPSDCVVAGNPARIVKYLK
jgi:acetyltransferase-like isoleucine patch superfamily enzyme